MIIKNGRIFLNGRFVETDVSFRETILDIGENLNNLNDTAVFDASGCYVIPGLVDIHTHGAAGEDFSDGNPAGLQRLADYYAAHGVTSYLATTMTLPEKTLAKALHALRDFRREGGAKCAGVHLEGPFLSYARRGAQAAAHIQKPDFSIFQRLNDASGGQIKIVTVACETEGALDFICQAARHCTVSLGHTDAGYDIAMSAFDAGASHATHLFNAMPPFLHRAPGVIGAALDANASAELICDGFHIHPAVIRAAYKLLGDKLNFVSDSLRCAGMPDGGYELGGQPVIMQNGKAVLPDGTLAGSSISLLDGVRNAARFGVPLEAAVYAASTAPAEAAGLAGTGVIAPGRAADFAVLDRELRLRAVFIDGRPIKLKSIK